MTKTHHEVLCKVSPRRCSEFEERLATEEACREYVAACRWNGRPRCHQCDSDRVWSTRGGTLYECASCGHQTSIPVRFVRHIRSSTDIKEISK